MPMFGLTDEHATSVTSRPGFRERFHGRFGYPFNRPTIEREKFYGDRSRKTTFFWTMFFRRLEMSWSSPWEPEDA
jgi:hypothetical protein